MAPTSTAATASLLPAELSDRVFPLWATEGGKCTCHEGAACERAGKHPAVSWTSFDPIEEQYTHDEGDRSGVATGDELCVIDCDDHEAVEWARTTYPELQNTFTVLTARGAHFYVWVPPEVRVLNSASKLYKGVDVRGDGGFVVAPGSMHKSGHVYQAVSGLDIQEATAALVAAVRDDREATEDKATWKPATWHVEARLEAFRAEHHVPDGSKHLLRFCALGKYGYRLASDVLRAELHAYNSRCTPPWSEHDLEHKLEDAVGKYGSSYAATGVDLYEARLTERGFKAAIAARLWKRPTNDTAAESTKDGMYFSGFAGWHTPPPPVGWLIKDVIPASSVGVVFGPPGCNKTFLAVSMAIAVSLGKPWCGHETTREPCQTGWLDYDSNGAAEAYRRVALLGGLDATRFRYQPCPDEMLQDAAFWKKLPRNLKFLIIDTLASGSVGIEENSKEAAYPIMSAQRFRNETGCAVLILHHSLKSNDEMYRGATAIQGAVDYMYFVRKAGNDLTLVSKKFRNGQAPANVEVRLVDKVGMVARNDATDPDADWKPSALDSRILEYLRNCHGRGYFPSKEDICGGGEVKGKKTDKRDRLEHLVGKGQVGFSERHKGYRLDSEQLSELRILDAVRDSMRTGETPLMTPKAIADAAEVSTKQVERLVGKKIFKGGQDDGFMTTEETPTFYGRARVEATKGRAAKTSANG